jgi:hypothetical protein
MTPRSIARSVINAKNAKVAKSAKGTEVTNLCVSAYMDVGKER